MRNIRIHAKINKPVKFCPPPLEKTEICRNRNSVAGRPSSVRRRTPCRSLPFLNTCDTMIMMMVTISWDKRFDEGDDNVHFR